MQHAPIDRQDAQPASPQFEPALPLRSDTILGVCEALGEDFGFNANYLRVVLASLVLWSPVAALGIYLALGTSVAVSRLVYPAPRRIAAPEVAAPAASPANKNHAEAELLAA